MIVESLKSFEVAHIGRSVHQESLCSLLLPVLLAKMSKNNCMKNLIAKNLLSQVVQISQMAKSQEYCLSSIRSTTTSEVLYNKFNCSCCWRQFQIRRQNFRIFSIWRQISGGPRSATFHFCNQTFNLVISYARRTLK